MQIKREIFEPVVIKLENNEEVLLLKTILYNIRGTGKLFDFSKKIFLKLNKMGFSHYDNLVKIRMVCNEKK